MYSSYFIFEKKFSNKEKLFSLLTHFLKITFDLAIFICNNHLIYNSIIVEMSKFSEKLILVFIADLNNDGLIKLYVSLSVSV